MTILRPIVLLALSPEPSQLTFQLAQCLVVSHCFPVSIRCSMLCQPAIGLLIIQYIIYSWFIICICRFSLLYMLLSCYCVQILDVLVTQRSKAEWLKCYEAAAWCDTPRWVYGRFPDRHRSMLNTDRYSIYILYIYIYIIIYIIIYIYISHTHTHIYI